MVKFFTIKKQRKQKIKGIFKLEMIDKLCIKYNIIPEYFNNILYLECKNIIPLKNLVDIFDSNHIDYAFRKKDNLNRIVVVIYN